MKKVLLIALAFLAGCATAQQPARAVPQAYKDRIIPIVRKAQACVNPGITIGIKIAQSGEPNAWADDKSIGFTEGILAYDDETLLFIAAHELAHIKLGHLRKAQGVSYATTGVMLIVNALIPGAGYLNHVVNPAIVNNYSKTQEYEADKLASQVSASCMGISMTRQVVILQSLKARTRDGGGFWDRHPSWEERIANIQRKE